uniref:hypothetical protein n=1 Tax=Sinomicrobium oceani TaxID=1150368 RepID=UPI00227C1012
MKYTYSEVKEKVEYLEERILHNFDKYLNYLVLEDFYDGGYEERIDDEWFYEEYFESYEKDIINLLLEIGEEDKEYYDFQLRLIRLKRIIDTKLNKLSKAPGETEPVRRSRISYFILDKKIKKDEFIESLYNGLSIKNFIE